jgi:acyl-CoA synthetase (NDP forming)
MTISFQNVINPRTVAIIGASDDMTKFGGRIIGYLLKHDFKGKIYPINRKRDTVRGLKCYQSVLETPEPPDVAVMAIPPAAVVATIKECVQRGTGCAIIITTGFAEMSAHGRQLQDELLTIARSAQMRVWGPNCMGLVNPVDGVALSSTYTQDVERLIPGSIGMVSQSGGLFAAIFNRANDEKIGLRAVCSTGNEADIDTTEILDYFLNDDKTRVLATYTEGFRNPKRFIEIAQKALVLGKPIVMFKVGSSEQGRRAALSHTASLAGSDQSFNDLCKQYGIIRVHQLETLLPTANLFARYGIPSGSQLAVIGASGGHAGIIPDRAEYLGLKLSKLSQKTQKFLYGFIEASQSINPADLAVSDMNIYRQCVEAIGADPEVDALLYAFGTTPEWEKRMGYLISYGEKAPVPVFFYTLVGSKAGDIPDKAREAGIPFFWNLDQCLTAIRDWFWYGELRQKRLREKEKLSRIPRETIGRWSKIKIPNKKQLTELEAKDILDQLGIRTPERRVARSVEEARSLAKDIGFPVVLKALSADLSHKTDIGAVKLGLKDEDALDQAYREIVKAIHESARFASTEGLLIEKMIPGGLEVILGAQHDSQFGAQILLGLGGIYAEIINKTATRFVPLSPDNIQEMFEETQLDRFLAGKRNQESLDKDALTDALLRIAAFMEEHGRSVQELDINPLIVLPRGKGLYAVDALIITAGKI